jgi:hypothetical protein
MAPEATTAAPTNVRRVTFEFTGFLLFFGFFGTTRFGTAKA